MPLKGSQVDDGEDIDVQVSDTDNTGGFWAGLITNTRVLLGAALDKVQTTFDTLGTFAFFNSNTDIPLNENKFLIGDDNNQASEGDVLEEWPGVTPSETGQKYNQELNARVRTSPGVDMELKAYKVTRNVNLTVTGEVQILNSYTGYQLILDRIRVVISERIQSGVIGSTDSVVRIRYSGSTVLTNQITLTDATVDDIFEFTLLVTDRASDAGFAPLVIEVVTADDKNALLECDVIVEGLIYQY